MQSKLEQKSEDTWPPAVVPTMPYAGKPLDARMTRWKWLDRTFGVLVALTVQGGLTIVLTLALMIIHLRNDTNDTHGEISWFHCACALCPPLLLSLVLFALSRRIYRAFSQGLFAGMILVSTLVLADIIYSVLYY
jgi:uncharacterized membrane protein YhdT